MKKVAERSSRVTRGNSANRQSGPSSGRENSANRQPGPSSSGRKTRSLSASGTERTSNARKRKCPAEDKSSAKRSNVAQDPMPSIQRRQFGDRMGDAYCWICHKFSDEFYCPDCPRVYHNDCLRKIKTNADDPLCQCKWTSVDGINSYTKVPSNLKDILGKVLHRIIEERKNKKLQLDMSDYMKLLYTFPEEYERNVILCEPMDIEYLIDKINITTYKNTGEFFQDVKWMYHNSCIAFGTDHEITTTALKFEKAVKQQLSDLEACGECYQEKCVQCPEIDFFTKICSPAHSIVWAKLKGFPFWPAKCLRIVNGHADVRFFGTHDKSLIPLTQVFKISRRNPGGNPKKPKNSSRMTSYEESMAELNMYIANYEKQSEESFQYFNEKTPLEPVKKSGRRARQNKNGNQLEVPMNIDIDDHRDPSREQALPSLNVSLLHDDPIETKSACRNVLRSSSVVLEKLTSKNNEYLSQMGMESSVVCHMTFDEECHGEIIPDEGIEGASSSHSQLPEIPVQVTVASVKGSPELCVNVSSSQVLLNNVETAELDSNNYINMNACDNSAAMPSTSDSPLLITSTQSLSSIVSNAMSDISKINAHESLTSEENIKRTFDSIIGDQALPELLSGDGDDDEIQVLRENTSGSLVAGVFKNQPMLKTFCELLLGNKPNIRNYIASFQNMALHFYLAMFLEANTGKLNANECKMFHSIYEKLCKAVETLKGQVRELKAERDELASKLKQKISYRERIINAQVKKNNEDLSFYKKEIIRLVKELGDSKDCVGFFRDAKSKSEKESEMLKAEIKALKVQKESEIVSLKEEIEALKKQREEKMEALKIQKEQEIEVLKKQKEEIENLKKQKELEVKALKKLNEEEIETLKKQKEFIFENLKKQIKELLNINTEKEVEIKDLKKQKAEVEDIKNHLEEKLKNMQNKLEAERKESSQIQKDLHERFEYLMKQNLHAQEMQVKCKSNDMMSSCCTNSDQSFHPFTHLHQGFQNPGAAFQCTETTEFTIEKVFITQNITNASPETQFQNEEVEEEEKEKDEVEQEEEDEEKEEREKEEEDEEKEEEEEEEEEEDDEEEEYNVKEDASEEEEEEAENVELESKSSVGSKLRSSRNTIAKPSSSRNYSRTRARATTKVQKAVKLVKKATKPPKKRAPKTVIRKRK